MKKNRRIIFILLCFSAVQCTARLTETVETSYFEIRYPYEEAGCAQRIEKALRIRSFSENIPYDRNDMVVLGLQREVKLSFKNQWVGRPGDMIAQKLVEDFTRDPLFSRVVADGDPFAAPLELDGKVFQFAWAEENSRAEALLDIEVSISSREDAGALLFNRQYRFQSLSRPMGEPKLFAEAMSNLIQQFSIALRKDVCAALKEKKLRIGRGQHH
jgi:ABC-type uncharacterized transport system auxiliary subunit